MHTSITKGPGFDMVAVFESFNSKRDEIPEIVPVEIPAESPIEEDSVGNYESCGLEGGSGDALLTGEAAEAGEEEDEFLDCGTDEATDEAADEAADEQTADETGDDGDDDFTVDEQADELTDEQAAELPNELSEELSEEQQEQLKQQVLEDLEKQSDDLGMVTDADFSEYDPAVAEQAVEAMADAQEDFPDLQFEYFGTTDEHAYGIWETVSDGYAADLKAENGDKYTDEEYRRVADAYADEYISATGLDDTEGTYAWQFHPGDDFDLDELNKYNGIAVKNEYACDNAKFSADLAEQVEDKHLPVGCDTPKATFDHELGHEIDRHLNAENDLEIRQMYDEMMDGGNAENELSGYSQTNINEFIAEAYSEYRNNPEPRAYSTKVYNRLIELENSRR